MQAGDALLAEGKTAQALAAYRRAAALAPRDGRTRMKLAAALERAQLWGDAGREAMRAADLLPGDYDARALAARLVLGQSRFEDSLAMSTALLRERPDDTAMQIVWATAQARLSSPYAALFALAPTGGRGEAYDRACTMLRPRGTAEQDRDAEATLRRILERDPKHFDARFALVGLLWAARRADQSEALLQAMADELPAHKTLNEAAGQFFLARERPDLGERYLRRAAESKDPGARAPRLALIDRYLATGRQADAAALLDGFDADDDEGGAVSLRRARAAFAAGQHAEALAALARVTTRYPTHAEALALRSRVLLETGKPADAADAGRLAVKADALRSDTHLALARALEAMGDLDGAYREYAETLKQDPEALPLTLTLAELGLATDRRRAALAYARQAAGAFPQNERARLIVVEALIRAGDGPGADFWLAPLLRLPTVPIEAWVLRGLALDGRGDEAGARSAFEQALRAAPDSVRAIAAVAAFDLDHGRVAEARDRVAAALVSQPDDPLLLRLTGRIRIAQGDLPGAERALRRGRARYPADTDTAILLAQTLAKQRRAGEARDLLAEVLKRRPSSLVAQTEMAALLEGAGRLNDAQMMYQAVIAEYPEAIRAAARLAVVLVTLGREPNIALNIVAIARRLAPDDPEVLDAVGWAQLHLDQMPEALQQLERAAEASPANASFQFHLGTAFIRAGRLDDGRAALERALALDPATPDRQRIDAELARTR